MTNMEEKTSPPDATVQLAIQDTNPGYNVMWLVVWC